MAQKRVKFVTTTGRCQYPYLTKPDTQFDAEGVYKVNLIVDDCQDLLDTCKQLAEEEFGKKDKYRLPITKDEDSGEHLIKVKSKYAPQDSEGFDSVEGGFVVSEVTEDEDTFDAKEEAETKEAADRF